MTHAETQLGSLPPALPVVHDACSDVDIVTLQNPFDHLYRDSDVEGMTDGFDDQTAYGEIDGIDDASMVRGGAACALQVVRGQTGSQLNGPQY